MRRILLAATIVLSGLVLSVAPAEAKPDSALAGCRQAAAIYRATGNTGAAPVMVVQLKGSTNKSVRNIAAVLALDATDKAALRRLKTFCKKHYPRDKTIRLAAFVVPTTTTTPSTTTTTTTTTVPPPPPTPAPTAPPAPAPTQSVAPAPPQQSCANGSYINSDGQTVCSPSSNPAGATARCNDGTYSYATHHQGACSSHGGVAEFYN
jgi:predicted component of type VI protein secretion system